MRPDEIRALIQQAIPNVHVEVQDVTGTSDHFKIYVVSGVFEGKTLIEQHRLVQQSLQTALDDGRIHAVQIKTETPGEWAKKRPKEGDFKIIA